MTRTCSFILCSTIAMVSLIVIVLSAHADDAQRQKDKVFIETLMRLESLDLNANAAIKQKVLGVLSRNEGTELYLDIVERFKLTDEAVHASLLTTALAHPSQTPGVRAAGLVMKHAGVKPFEQVLDGDDASAAVAAATVLGRTADRRAYDVLAAVATDAKRPRQLRTAAVAAFGGSLGGEKRLLQLVEAGEIDKALHFTAANVLLASSDPAVRSAAGEHLGLPPTLNSKPLPPIARLAAMRGDAANGLKVMKKTQCFTCHRVGDDGFDVGPALTEIGSKLSRDAMYTAILDPSAGIEHNFAAWHVETQDGDELVGVLISETDEEIVLRVAGGVTHKLAAADIYAKRKLETSLMPPGLQQAMTQQELVDLVEYLTTLRKK